jgi:plastocyanin
MVTNDRKMTLGGSWLLLTLLMIGMSWGQAVAPATDAISAAEAADESATVEDPLALSNEAISRADYGYADEMELVGSRTETSKTYLAEDGGKVAIVSPMPIHYLDDDGAWDEIDLNIESGPNGWSVTENLFSTEFALDVNRGVSVVVDDNIDPILTGLNPTVVTISSRGGEAPMLYPLDKSGDSTQVGANVIRYPLGEGVSLDYEVTSTQLKQNLVVREMPYIEDGFNGWFGLSEEMILPEGYSIFQGESPLRDGELLMTNDSLEIRNKESGELLVSMPAPLVQSIDPESVPQHATYFVRQFETHVSITTAVLTEWLTDDNTSYPLAIDPSLDVTAQRAGYSYYYSYASWWGGGYTTYERAYASTSVLTTCRGANSYYTACLSSSTYQFYYRYSWYRFDLANTMPSGATVDDVDFESHVGRYRTGARSFDVAVLKSGSSQSSTMIDPSSYLYSYGQYLTRYIRNSAASSSSTSLSDPGYYWYGGNVRSITMNQDGIDDVQDAADGNAAGSSGNILGLGVRNTANAPYWYWCSTGYYVYYGCTGNAKYPHLAITYHGGSDTTPPDSDFAAYTGKTTWIEGARTLRIGLLDASGVDTSGNNPVKLHYNVNNGSWGSVTATTIGTCLAAAWCNFKATLPASMEDDYVNYFWAFADTPTSGNQNLASLPAGATMTGTDSVTSPPSSPYWFYVGNTDYAAVGDNKWTIHVTGQNSWSYYNAQKYYNYQFTYYEDNREYHQEFDTSACGTGSNSCFNTGSVFQLRYYPGTYRVCTSTNCQTNLAKTTLEGLSMNAQTGPGSDVIWSWDANYGTSGGFGVVQVDVAGGNDIGKPNGQGAIYTTLDYGSLDDGYVKIPIPGDITGYFGSFTWNSTYNLNSANRNLFCVNTNANPVMFVRSTYTGSAYSNPCYSTYYYWQYDYAWNGWAAPGYDGKWDSGWKVASKVSSIRPAPDIWPPDYSGGTMMDTYVEDSRTLTVGIVDAGDPPSGLNVSTGTDADGILEGPHMNYRTYDAENGVWSAWTERTLAPSGGASRASCELVACDWATTIPGTDRGNSVEYTIHSKDNIGNWNNTTAQSYEIGTPTKVFVVEWHDLTCGFQSTYKCSFQVRLYDQTNEIEFAYDSNSNGYYDWQYIGLQNPAGTIGENLRGRGPGYIAGANPFTTNYRIATDGDNYGVEEYGVGMTELFNYDEEMVGASNGWPYTYYCTRYWSSYRGDCSAVIDLPNDFEFDYFGSTFNGTQGHKIHAIRHGAMQFSTSSSSNSAQMMYYGWGTTMPNLPSSSSYVRNVDLAPWWGYYASYYCYYDSSSECSIRSKMIPFDGAGMDVTADITEDTTWDHEQSPIRIIPSGDYLQVSADLTIEAGVEVQIAQGKGIVFTGACNTLTANGNSTDHVTITNLGTANAKGLAFTNGCTDTDDRHTFTSTDFSNMDIAISAGSRHGTAPHYNGNVGNFTFDQVTFDNVDTAISHGSGQGTGFDLSGVTMNNSADSCIDMPADGSLRWVGGGTTNCNTHGYAGQGAIETGSGTSIYLENVDFTDSGVNGITGSADSLTMSNVTVTTPGYSAQQTGTAVAQLGTSTSGTSIYAFNVDMEGYEAALTTHAADEIHLEDLSSSGDSNGYYIAPAGASSPTVGATGWTMDGIAADGGLTIARTQPASMDNINLGGALVLSGTAPSSNLVAGSDVTASGLTVNGCGWKVDFSDVSLGDMTGTDGAWVSANCLSTSSSNVITVSDVEMDGCQNNCNDNFVYARNSVVTVAEAVVTGMTMTGSYLAQASTNGDIRLVDVNFDSNDCLDSNDDYAGQGTCWVQATSSTAKIYFGGTGSVSVYRTVSGTDVFQPNHKITTSVYDSSGVEMYSVGTSKTDGNGAADVWLITDLLERDSNGNTVVSDSYADHSIRATGGAGQNVTTPTDPWYTAGFNLQGYPGDLPLEVGESVYLKLEAFPMDFNGATKDCTFLATNDSASLDNGYYTYTMQLLTLSTNLVLDGCSVHLNGTMIAINRTGTSNPVITLRNGGELLVTEGGGEAGRIIATSSVYGWDMNIESGGLLTLDNAYIRDMNGGLLIGEGATVNMIGGAVAYGSPNAAAGTATLNVQGGTLTANNAKVQNANSGTGILLEDTASSSLSNIIVKNADVGIQVTDAAPTIDGFTLTNNTVGMDVYGGMSLPSIYRSTRLSGESAGWTTHAIDITSFAKNSNFVQVGLNSVYMGGNSDPVYGSYYAKYYLTYDRMRIAVDSGSGLTNVSQGDVGYYPYGTTDPAENTGNVGTYDGGVGGEPVWDCNYYGYQYNPGGSYQYGYYYYIIQYGGYINNGGYNNYPLDFGFRVESATDVTQSTNYYPYHFWASYWPSFYYSGQWAPPEGFNGMWGSYNVCQDYAYSVLTPKPAGFRVAFPIVDTTAASIDQVVLYVDMVHYGADYFADRLDVTVRTGNSVSSLLSKDYAREFGTASISNGQITGADTGLNIGGSRAAADITSVTVSDPVNEGVLVDGSVAITLDGLEVDGGSYGVRLTSAAGGKLGLTNVDLDGQTQDGLALTRDMNLELSGTISNAVGAAIKIPSSSAGDWEFDSLTLTNSGAGVDASGSGSVTMIDCNLAGNTNDVALGGSTLMTYVEGTIDLNSVAVSGSALFERARQLDVSVTADTNGMADAPVKLLDADNKVVDSGMTDASGTVDNLLFFTQFIDANGQTTVNLNGYQAVTIAKVAYTSGSEIDIRYDMKSVPLNDAAGNTASLALTDSIDARTCYMYTSSSYETMATCSGLGYTGSRTVSGVTEYGYGGLSQSSTGTLDMTNKVIQLDSPWNYFQISSYGISFNNSIIFTTGTYNSITSMYPNYPYQGHVYMDDTTVIAMGDESTGNPSGFKIGYSGTYSYGNYHIHNSALLGLVNIATGSGYYQANGDLDVTDSTLVHYRVAQKASSIFYDDMCIYSAGYDDVTISGNTMIDCGVGVMVPNSYYATSVYYSGNGTNNLHVNDNTMIDVPNLAMWYYLGATVHNAQFNGNTITGTTIPSYGVYSQDATSYTVEVDGNDIHAENPIYFRGARNWDITNNQITGDSNAAHAGIYALNGWGTISGNTLTDADGGIALSGIRSGNEVHIDDNTIGSSAGRLPTSAVGIYVDNCGLDDVFMSNNAISTVMNAVNTNGCTLSDNGSVYSGMGGTASTIHSVDQQASTFSPAIVNVSVGDTVKWTSRAYGPGGTPHTTTSDDGLWDSGTMNLGSSFMYQFNSQGSFNYTCSAHSSMTGTVNVGAASGTNLQTVAFDILGGGDDITLNGVTISGYGLGIDQSGGDLTLAGGTTILGDAVAVALSNVDLTVDGATLGADSAYGVALDVESTAGYDTLDITGLSVSGSVGALIDGHSDFRWNGGTSSAGTTLKTLGGATGTLENMSGPLGPWSVTYGYGTNVQINAGAYSTITSIGNGVLNNGMIGAGASKLVIDSDAIVHEGNLLDLTVLHMGGAATDVGLFIRSVPDLARSEYVSPSWRSRAGAPVTVDGNFYDWLGTNMLNDADDMMPGPVAVNASTGAHMRVTWDSQSVYIAIIGASFSITDGMLYLDTGAGGSNQGDTWYVSHTLPFQADYMLWMEDLNNWGIRRVMPTGNWVDTTSSCTGIDFHLATGTDYVSEFRLPWSCIGDPVDAVRWLAIVQWDPYPGVVAGVYPEQPFDNATNTAQTFGEFGTFNVNADHGDLDDGLMDDFLLIFRSYVGSTTPGSNNIYQIMVKTRNVEGDYWDWGSAAPIVMTSNQDITIDIQRAKPIITENMVDVEYNEDSGLHTISLTNKATDIQDDDGALLWIVTDAASNTHTYPTPYSYSLTGQTLDLSTLPNQFGGHRLQMTVMDSHGMFAYATMMVGVHNVNDAPVICNANRGDCMPVFYDDGFGNLNVHDENFNGLITKGLGDTANASRSYVIDMMNEQTQTDWNSLAVPQTYGWTSATGPCTPFTATITNNVMEIDENTANEAGGTCTITLDLTDGIDNAASVDVDFTVNPVNDVPEIKDFDAQAGTYVETANGSLQLDWYWDVMEDDENSDNLTFDLSRLMHDNDHPVGELTWDVQQTQLCTFGNYFTITVDNDADTLEFDLIDDAATDAPTSEIDFLQDADGNGEADDGVHQMQPASGVYCTVYLWLNDTASAPGHINYSQSASGHYEQRTTRETINIRVINTPEARPDYHFDEDRGFNFLNVEAILPGTRIPIDIDITNDVNADDPALYNYEHDLQVRFFVDDNPTLVQDQITVAWDDIPARGDTSTLRGWVTLNSASTEVRAFIEVRTINPHTTDYVDASIRRPALEELNWGNNNMTTTDTGDQLPAIVSLRPAMSVASFAPGLMAVSLVGAFVAMLLFRNRSDEDEEEAIEDNEAAVSPVIATILLVAITVVLSGVIYIWANSLADTSGKANPRLTFDADARYTHTSDQDMWYWRIAVTSHDDELAAQAVYVTVEWLDDSGDRQVETTHLANREGVYGRVPSNSPNLVTYKDSIDCSTDCSVGFGANDVIQVRMVNDGAPLDEATITLQYAPEGGHSVPLMVYHATFNPPNIRATP